MKRNLNRWALLVGLGVALLAAGPVQAQQPTPSDDQVNAIAKQLYCPVCENTPLDVCPSQACAQWRELIRQKLAAGWSEEQIKTYFVVQYGDRVLPAPPLHGMNWLAYLLPPLLILGGGVLLFSVLRQMRRNAQATGVPANPPVPPEEAAPADDYLRRLEEELHKREK